MRSIAIFLALIGFSSAATIFAMDEREFQEAMMKEMFARQSVSPVMGASIGFGGVMGQQNDGPGFDVMSDAAEEEAAEREARGAEESKLMAADSNGHHSSGFPNMMGMMFPAMMFNGGMPFGDAPYNGNGYHSNNNGNAHSDDREYQRPANGNGHHITANGNGHHQPSNGNSYGYSRPTNGNGNGQSRPVNGNGKKNPGGAAASATTFTRGSNSFASSHAQAFGGF